MLFSVYRYLCQFQRCDQSKKLPENACTVDFGFVKMKKTLSLVNQSEPFFLFNMGGMVVDNAVYHLSISPSIPEIFAVKIES